MISELMTEKKAASIDLFFLIDDLNHNNKVWLLETDTDDNQSKFALWLLAIITVLTMVFFIFRSSILTSTLATSFSLVDFIFIAVYFASLTWAGFTTYWEYVYYRPFFRHKQLMNKEIPEAFAVIKR